MTPIVLQLQELAASGDASVSELLRKARIVASKLKLDEFNDWLQHELHGYPPDANLPEYRIFFGDLRAHNPMNGILMPVRFNVELTEALSRIRCRQSIGSLEDVLKGASNGLQVPLSPRDLEFVHGLMDEDAREWVMPFRRVSPTQLSAILDRVRSIILDWSLQLESQGIVGDGMTFSEEEKQRATTQSVHINNFQGVFGNVTNSSVTQRLEMKIDHRDLKGLLDFMRSQRIPEAEVQVLQEAILADAEPTERKHFGKNVSSWLGRLVSAGYDLAVGASGELLANAIWSYYGF